MSNYPLRSLCVYASESNPFQIDCANKVTIPVQAIHIEATGIIIKEGQGNLEGMSGELTGLQHYKPTAVRGDLQACSEQSKLDG